MAQGSIELNELDPDRSNDVVQQQYASNDSSELPTPSSQPSLPPVDRGKEAWLFLAACWVVEAFVFGEHPLSCIYLSIFLAHPDQPGFGFSFGVYQDFYSTNEPFVGSRNIAVIGTTTMVRQPEKQDLLSRRLIRNQGTMYMITPFVLMLCRLLPNWARWFSLMGLFAAAVSLALSSFCTTVPQLIGTQGLLFGFGGCFAYTPCLLYINEWFDKRKGMAYGVMYSAAGFGGVVLPLLLQTLLNNLGFETATRVWAGILFGCSAPLAFFVKPRLPNSETTHVEPFNLRHIMSKLFALHTMANFIQATGFFLPGIYLPTYARTVFGASHYMSALTLMLTNISSTMGCVILGWMTDKFHVTTCIIISAVGTAISVLLVWGFTTSLPVLYVYCVLYGLFAGGWTSVYPGVMKEITQKGENANHRHVEPVMVIGMLLLGRGVGNMISGPLSEALIRGMPWQGQAIGGYGSGYGGLIIYSGLTGLASGTNFVFEILGLI
jgi:MFS family permease